MAKRDGGTFQATVVVDGSDIGGEVRLLVGGRTYVVSGSLKRGLRDLADAAAHDKAFWGK